MAAKQNIGKKIDDLFAYRRIPHLLKLAGIDKSSEFVQKLKDLQATIYALDEYLETTWDVRKNALAKHWKDINTCLRDFGLNRYQVAAFRKEVERYQSYELEMRDGKMPTRRPFKTTYGAKSCDVRLIRKLIYNEAPQLKKLIRERDWRYYDLISEVNDDISDVYEDLDRYNGNRFLVSLLTRGKGKTRSEFNAFLRETGKNARLRFKKQSGMENDVLAAQTARRLDQTRVLLKKRLGQPKIKSVKSAVIRNVIPRSMLLR